MTIGLHGAVKARNDKNRTSNAVAECIEGSEAFRRFDEGMRQVLSVSRSTLVRRERAYKKKSLENPNRRGPKPKIDPSGRGNWCLAAIFRQDERLKWIR
jgi:hypothetical protein